MADATAVRFDSAAVTSLLTVVVELSELLSVADASVLLVSVLVLSELLSVLLVSVAVELSELSVLLVSVVEPLLSVEVEDDELSDELELLPLLPAEDPSSTILKYALTDTGELDLMVIASGFAVLPLPQCVNTTLCVEPWHKLQSDG